MSAIVLVQAGLGAGGVEKVIAQLGAHLAGQGHTVTILAIDGAPQEAYYPTPPEVTVRTMKSEMGPAAAGRTPARIGWIRRCIKEHAADLVLSFLTKINIQTSVACIGLNVGLIVSERNNFRLQKMNALWRLLMPVAIAAADHAVMLTKAQKAQLPTWARRNASVIYNAIDPPDPVQTPSSGTDLVAVGRLTEQKGFDILLHAMQRGREAGHDLRLTIYGEGEDRAMLKGLSERLGLASAVVFAGRTATPHTWQARRGIFILSSRYEGFGNVLIEAMAGGFAIVSSNCDWGPSEIITSEENGILVPTGDPQALCDAILRLRHDDALRQRLSSGALRRSLDFSSDRIMNQWEHAIDTVLSGRRLRSSRQHPSSPAYQQPFE